MKDPFVSRPVEAAPANRLLIALPASERRRVLAAAEPAELALGQVLMKPGERVTHAWFPVDAVISLGIASAPHQECLEVALVGREGVIGLPLLLGAGVSGLQATVVKAGRAIGISAADLRVQLLGSPALQRQTQRYVLVMMAVLAQASLCTRHHQVEQRLARWLLMTHDRVQEAGFHATHEFLAATLGVRRAGITRAAANLQRRQLISYRRGEMSVLDRPGLQAAACSCYAADCASYTTLMHARRP
ncbi:MAG: Crp/Fnr family transcriptional regulator [Ramlibacter sp.]|nr:Crp/Fnr family transcriptional regulator [Ramlibacter sp.]